MSENVLSFFLFFIVAVLKQVCNWTWKSLRWVCACPHILILNHQSHSHGFSVLSEANISHLPRDEAPAPLRGRMPPLSTDRWTLQALGNERRLPDIFPEASQGSTMLARLITASADLRIPPEELEEAAGKQDICAALPAAPAVKKLRQIKKINKQIKTTSESCLCSSLNNMNGDTDS